jgi:uncharacterized protein YgiM (DUF1202 family)
MIGKRIIAGISTIIVLSSFLVSVNAVQPDINTKQAGTVAKESVVKESVVKESPSGLITTKSVSNGYGGWVIGIGQPYTNIRSGPGTSYPIVGKLNYGSTTYILSTSNGWCYFSYNGQAAYVSASYVNPY